MRKLKCVDDGDHAFINKVIDSTRKRNADDGVPENQTYKARCKTIVTSHEEYIKKYDEAFKNNKLEALENTHPNLNAVTKEDLKELYSFSRKDIAQLRRKVLTEEGYENNFCPLCEINLVNTMDHFIPQTGYPLFAIHPRNLIPSCSLCNGHKSDTITDKTGKRKFWNVYLDTPPEEQYLFGDVIEREGLPWVKFRIEQGKIDDETFRLIQNTMDNNTGQKMFSVYEQVEGKYICELKNHCVKLIKRSCDSSSFEECIKNIKNDIIVNFTLNSCEDVIKLALIDSPIFLRCVERELQEQKVPYKKDEK